MTKDMPDRVAMQGFLVDRSADTSGSIQQSVESRKGDSRSQERQPQASLRSKAAKDAKMANMQSQFSSASGGTDSPTPSYQYRPTSTDMGLEGLQEMV